MTGRALITGAAGALGRSVVKRFLDEGDRVLAVDAVDGALASLTGLFSAETVAVRRADLTSTPDVERLFAEAEEAADPFSKVVHLVGGFRWARFADLSDDDWKYLVDLNLETTFRIFRESARLFERAGGGVLVAVSSPAALLGEAGVGGYAGAKAAVLRMVESLAREIAPHGGRANAVLPGTMDTPANRAAMPDADPSQWVTTDAVAAVIYYLTTRDAAAINGSAVRVPGKTL